MGADELEQRLLELYDQGRRAWPELELERDVFAARATPLIGDDRRPLHGEDLYIAFACAEGREDAIAIFDRRYLTKVPLFLTRLRKPKAFVDEVTQRLREKLFVGSPPTISAYAGKGTLDGWLSVVATRLALDFDDSERRHAVADAPDTEALAMTIDPELAYIRERYLPQFTAAFDRSMRELTVEERNLLRFYMVDGLNIAQIGAIFGKSRTTIGRWLVDCRVKILDGTKAALAASLGSDRELSSLIRMLHSQLDVSVRDYLDPAAP